MSTSFTHTHTDTNNMTKWKGMWTKWNLENTND